MHRCKEVKIFVEGDEYVIGTLVDGNSDRYPWSSDDLEIPEADYMGQELIIMMHGLNCKFLLDYCD